MELKRDEVRTNGRVKVEMIVAGDYVDEVNDFIKDKDVIDIKMTTLLTDHHFATTRYLVIYREDSQ